MIWLDAMNPFDWEILAPTVFLDGPPPEVLPGWKDLPKDMVARHISLRISRKQTHPDAESRKILFAVLRQTLAADALDLVSWHRWRWPNEDGTDEYVVGCLCRAIDQKVAAA